MAPDSDDHHDVRAAETDLDPGVLPHAPPDQTTAGPVDPSATASDSGDTTTQGTTGTVGGDAHPEGLISDHPGTTDDVGSDLAEAVSADQVATPDVGPDAASSAGFAEPEGAAAAEPEIAEVAVTEADAAEADGGGPDEGLAPATEGPVDNTPGDPKARNPRKLVAVLAVLSLVVVGAGVGGLIWSRSAGDQATPPPPTATASPSPTLSDGAFVTYHDPETGMSIRYPRGWTRSQAPVREIRLLVSDGKQFSALVRVTRTDVVTTPANLANLKAVTDGIVSPNAQILKQDPITVNGLIGFRYIYTVTDKDNGLVTAHLHYFLFQGHKMNSIVFEAVPSDTFSRIEGVFEQMLASFHSDPEPP